MLQLQPFSPHCFFKLTTHSLFFPPHPTFCAEFHLREPEPCIAFMRTQR